jgi:hypothetical protein
MKRLAKFVLVMCAVVGLSACYNPFSSPSGYTLHTTYRSLNGLQSGIAATISTEIVLPYAGATGSRSSWTTSTGFPFFKANSPSDVILPGDWAFHWQTFPCQGQTAIGEVQRYSTRIATCQEVISRSVSSISPSPVDFSAPPATIGVNGSGFSAVYGLPKAYLFDWQGIAQEQISASSVTLNGTHLEFPTSAVASLYNGYYTVMFYNINQDGTLQFVGYGEIEIMNGEDPPPDGPPEPCEPGMICE